ncbi:hypothetical protein EA472_11020 [Natrarchaeobius oligotrophus]|uniref:Uncharacterized protein n=2 Tax=Natrarchaeobius TaxID=2501796 RepID=A0A3N6M9Z2_NATCH|nr:hypothetical protein EA472_11020 [Natrarchaeobius chitinivorans]
MNDPDLRVVATLAVRVPLGATGDLTEGAVRIVERVDAVSAVTVVAVRRVAPGLNDTTVELEVLLTLEREDAGADDALARRRLEAGVGVEAVTDVETVEPDAPPVA